MKDAEFNALKAKLKALSFKWAERMGLGWYRLHFEWMREYAYSTSSDRRDTAAETKSYWQYREATITFYLEKLAVFDDDVLEETIIHELAHILVCPNEDFSDDARSQQTEYMTTCVAKAVKWAYDDGVKQGEKHDQRTSPPRAKQA